MFTTAKNVVCVTRRIRLLLESRPCAHTQYSLPPILTLRFSVILSTLNRAKLIGETLRSFQQLDAGEFQLEFVVVDNGSSDETGRVLDDWRGRLPLTTLYEPTPGKNICLNRAVQIAQGDYYIFTDDDVIVDQGWISAFGAAALRRPDDLLFAGVISPRFPESTPDWLREISKRYPVLYSHYEAGVSEGPTSKVPMGPNMMVKGSVFDQFRYDESIGPSGSNYAMGSETEFLSRVQRETGCEYIYVPTSRVEHIVRPEQVTEDWILGRAFRSGRGMARIITTNRIRLGGVPWPVWIRYYLAKAAGMVRRHQNLQNDFTSIWNRRQLDGCIYEFRNAASESIHPG